MFSWLKRRHRPTSLPKPLAVEPVYQWADDEIPRYPPFMKGLPPVPPAKLLETQAELIKRISDTAITTPKDFARFYVPAIERFASFAHLLPASQSHHHRGAGGLLRHSLEVGLWALQSADKVLLDEARTPSQRREMEPRWQFAVFVAALCHDAGKPVTDLVVTDRERTTVWKAIKENLHDWAMRHRVDAYFLDWRDGRAKHHTALANLIADRIIGTDALEWIEEGGTELIVWLLESLNCNPGPTNRIHDLVTKADQTSVERDLKSMGITMAGYDLGVPVERHITDIMRRFVQEGVWLVNTPGARLWNIAGQLYVIWPAAGEEIARQVREDGIPGIPRTPDGILDMLVERKIAFLRDGDSPGDRFWKIAPTCLSEKIPDIKLSAIRLRDDSLVSTTPIPAIEGRIIGDDDGASSATNENRNSATPDEATKPDAPTPAAATPEAPHGRAAKHETTAEPKRAEEMSVLSKPVEAKPFPEQKPIPQLVAAKSAATKIQLDGAIGEALKALVQDIKSGDKRVDEDVTVDAEGQLLLCWPGAFSGYGLTAKGILDELAAREWLWIDPMAPLKKVQDGQIGGKATKVIRLERDVSAMLVDAMGVTINVGRPASNTPPAPSAEKTPEHSGTAPVGCPPDRETPIAESPPPMVSRSDEARDTQPAATPQSQQMLTERPKRQKPKSKPARTGQNEPPSITTDATTMAGQQDLPLQIHDEAKRVHEAKTERTQPTLEDVLSVLQKLPRSPNDEGWHSIQKSDAIAACRKNGLILTHGHLARLAHHDTTRLTLDGVSVRYRHNPPDEEERK